MSEATNTPEFERTTMIEFVLIGDHFFLLPKIQEVFPDVFLAWILDTKNVYRASLYLGTREVRQLRFLQEHNIQYVLRERQRENIIKSFFAGVELEANRIAIVTVRRVVDIPDYQSVTLTTRDDEVVLRFRYRKLTQMWTGHISRSVPLSTTPARSP